MRLKLQRGLPRLGCLLVAWAVSCGNQVTVTPQGNAGAGGSPESGTGGVAGQTGAAPSGGAASGAQTSSGGASSGGANAGGGASSGGAAPSGGTPASGGAAPSGGTPASGGQTTVAGSAGAAEASGGAGGGEGDGCPLASGPSAGHVEANALSEASGLAASWRTPGVFYTVNDSAEPVVFAIDASGTLLATLKLDGALNEDWEDLGVGPGPEPNQTYLYVADIGDNDKLRNTSIVVHRTPEPTLSADESGQEQTLGHESLYLRYPDGPHNAETLLVDPDNADFYIITKGDSDGSRVYRATAPHSTTDVVELSYLLSLGFGSAPLSGSAFCTSGSISRDGRAILLRSYSAVFFWRRGAGLSVDAALRSTPCPLPIASTELQGEGITFGVDGDSYFTIGEGVQPTLFEFGLKF
ncbi:MAG: hypothetical protein QM756_13000 [Polyangiaceae bacterium]